VLTRVVAVAGDSVRVGATSVAALAPAAALPSEPRRPADPLTRARQLYLESRSALRRGDWAGVGRALEALGATLGAGGGTGAAP
jgi:hypothetical protein